MPRESRKPQGLTKNEITILSVIVAGLVVYIGYMLLFTGGDPEKPTGPTREVIVNNPDQPGDGDAGLTPPVKRKAAEWLRDKQEELASQPGVPEFEPTVQTYEDDDVRIPFRVMVKRQSEDLLERDEEDKKPALTE